MMEENVDIFLFIKDITLGGGAERVVVNMANQFVSIYPNVHIISRYKRNVNCSYNVNPCIKIHYLEPNAKYDLWQWRKNLVGNLIGGLFYSLQMTPKLYKMLDQLKKPQNKAVVLLNGYEIPIVKHANTFLIGVDHSHFPYIQNPQKTIFHRLYSFIEKIPVRNLDVVTCLTDSQILEWKSLKKPVHVMPNFIGDIPKKVVDNAVREKVILSMGRMVDEQKGFDRLIKSFAVIVKNYPEWKLRIIGDGVLKSSYKRMITALGIDSNVEMLDYTLTPHVEYKKASIYAMCSRWEGFPMVLIESMANGLPVVCYDIPYGPSYIIKNGETGFVFKDNDERNFINGLKSLMDDQEMRLKIGNAARVDVCNRFSADKIISDWRNLINKLVL